MRPQFSYLTEKSNVLAGSVSFNAFAHSTQVESGKGLALQAIGVAGALPFCERVGYMPKISAQNDTMVHHRGAVEIEQNTLIVVSVVRTIPSPASSTRGWASARIALSRIQSGYKFFIAHQLAPLLRVESVFSHSTVSPSNAKAHVVGRMREATLDEVIASGFRLPQVTLQAAQKSSHTDMLIRVSTIEAAPDNVKTVIVPAAVEGQSPRVEVKTFRKIRLQ
jgi:hypothetical protein